MAGRDRSPVSSDLHREAMTTLTRRGVLKGGVVLGAGALTATTPLQAIYAAAQDDSAQLTMAVEADPSTLDPHVNSNTRDSIFFHAMFDRLIERSPDGNLFPGLATEWSVADDNVTWTLALRDDVTFQDGTPFNRTPNRSTPSSNWARMSRRARSTSTRSRSSCRSHTVRFRSRWPPTR
jgi:hypothetical protein